jgi:hypothetical protein
MVERCDVDFLFLVALYSKSWKSCVHKLLTRSIHLSLVQRGDGIQKQRLHQPRVAELSHQVTRCFEPKQSPQARVLRFHILTIHTRELYEVWGMDAPPPPTLPRIRPSAGDRAIRRRAVDAARDREKQQPPPVPSNKLQQPSSAAAEQTQEGVSTPPTAARRCRAAARPHTCSPPRPRASAHAHASRARLSRGIHSRNEND